MPKRKDDDPTTLRTEVRIAKIIVGDTIRSAHTNPKLSKDATVEDALDLLKGPNGDISVQGVIAEYLGDKRAAEASGAMDSFDLRAINKPVNITAAALKAEMINQLEEYLNSTGSEHQTMLQEIMAGQ